MTSATAKANTEAHPSSQAPLPEVRHPEFDFPADLPKYWWDNDPVKTLLLAALSSSFPPGEKFFIDSVRHFQDRITDPELKKAVRAFIGQEAHHSKEHKEFNEFLDQRGIGLARLEREIQGFMDWMRSNLSPERQLAHTVAVEHFTAMMAEDFLLKYDEALEEMDPRIAPVWAWHAIEESEHKAVAFDVYKAIGGSEWTRISEMMFVSVIFPVFTSLHVIQLMKADGQLGNLKSWARAVDYMWGRPGVFRRMIPSYLRFYSPRFHPWNHNPRDMIEKAKRRWLPGY
ncbi:hypothetical protein C8D92_101250 [Tamilnaduibacter salinus]|uniref:Metal-dependent hydrolase n=1 Tax=Tamilnaduibacter salinus TaxID=1484056 RepID=A0A2A2I7N3_9GAMM|nr:metal-dependent hydrolase [Tamilnaduibacter salinus]PAV27125.1 metal-dependent hydrolase [Tamilnaduibacter salinus]PVY79044.1 hypothetical protein C8D92_101250 [Tamilnaduibacter salinus]